MQLSSHLATALLALVPTASQSAQDEWVDRLEVPPLFMADMEFVVDARAIGLPTGYDLGFDSDPEKLVSKARERMEAGDESARTKHELVLGLLRTGAFKEKDIPLFESCFKSYDEELSEAPDDVDKRMGFASVLAGAFRVTGVEPVFGEAVRQLNRAGELAPDDWRIHAELAAMCISRYSRSARSGSPEPRWLAKAVEAAEAGLDAAPGAPGAHWSCFHTRMMSVLSVKETPESMKQLCAWSDELTEGAARCEGGELLALCGQAQWMAMRVPMLLEDGVLGEADPDEELRARLSRFFAGLEAAEEHAFLPKIAPAGWIMHALTHPAGEDAARMTLVVDAGVDREWAMATALVLHQRSGHVEGVAALADALVEATTRDETRCALAAYFQRAGAHVRALGQLTSVAESTPARSTARGVLLLRLGRHAEALEVLESMDETPKDSPGMAEHTLGVALALNERPEDAIRVLTKAAALLVDPEPARTTLAELREKQ